MDLAGTAWFASAAVASIAVLSGAGLSAFRTWCALKRFEVERQPAGPATAAQRIDIADLRERIRRLEAIATGVDL